MKSKLIPKCLKGDTLESNNIDTLLKVYPEVSLDKEPWAEKYFRNNPNVAGMAIGGGLNGVSGKRRVIVNPYNKYMKDSILRKGLLTNERLRHYMDETNFRLPNITLEQLNKYKGTPYENDTLNIGRTEAARYLVNDKSNSLTNEQIKYINSYFNKKSNQKYKLGGIMKNKLLKYLFGGYTILPDNTRVNSPMLVTPIKRKLKPGLAIVHGAIITPKKEAVKKDIKPLVLRTKSLKKNKFIDLFTNATIGAAVADNPSIMAASGWKLNKNNLWELKPTKESKQLSENLSIISGLSPTHPATAVGDAIISKVAYPMYLIIKNKQLIPYIKSYLKHPTWETYYHGSPTSFDITQARMGTANDMGLHATKNRQVAKGFMEEDPTGLVYKFRAPRYKATTSDLWANGVQNHLNTNYVIKEHALDRNFYGNFNMLDKKLLNDIVKSKVPYKLILDPNAAIIGKYNFAQLKNASDITINPRSRFLEAIPKSKQALFNREADNLIELGNKIDGYSEAANVARSELNDAGAKLLDNYGITTVRYYNANPREGIIDSYWINNPSKIDPVYNFKLMDLKPGSAILPSILITKSYNEK